MRDLLLTDGELSVVNGDLATVDGEAALRQDVLTALRLFKGEWFLDTDQGVPYFDKILGQKNISTAELRRILAPVVMGREGVVSLDSCRVTIDNATRSATVRLTATTDLGRLTALAVEVQL